MIINKNLCNNKKIICSLLNTNATFVGKFDRGLRGIIGEKQCKVYIS